MSRLASGLSDPSFSRTLALVNKERLTAIEISASESRSRRLYLSLVGSLDYCVRQPSNSASSSGPQDPHGRCIRRFPRSSFARDRGSNLSTVSLVNILTQENKG